MISKLERHTNYIACFVQSLLGRVLISELITDTVASAVLPFYTMFHKTHYKAHIQNQSAELNNLKMGKSATTLLV